jgi:DNA-directed RNA polymerase specialized sigma24 family protein
MSRKQAAETELAETEALLDQLDPANISSPEADASDLRRVGEAADAIEHARETLREAVASARSRGRSWGQIGMVLGVSRQAARERFGTPSPRTATD